MNFVKIIGLYNDYYIVKRKDKGYGENGKGKTDSAGSKGH